MNTLKKNFTINNLILEKISTVSIFEKNISNTKLINIIIHNLNKKKFLKYSNLYKIIINDLNIKSFYKNRNTSLLVEKENYFKILDMQKLFKEKENIDISFSLMINFALIHFIYFNNKKIKSA